MQNGLFHSLVSPTAVNKVVLSASPNSLLDQRKWKPFCQFWKTLSADASIRIRLNAHLRKAHVLERFEIEAFQQTIKNLLFGENGANDKNELNSSQ